MSLRYRLVSIEEPTARSVSVTLRVELFEEETPRIVLRAAAIPVPLADVDGRPAEAARRHVLDILDAWAARHRTSIEGRGRAPLPLAELVGVERPAPQER